MLVIHEFRRPKLPARLASGTPAGWRGVFRFGKHRRAIAEQRADTARRASERRDDQDLRILASINPRGEVG